MAQSTNTQKVKYFVDFDKNGSFLELTDEQNKLTTAGESIDTTTESYATYGSAWKESEVTQYQSSYEFTGKSDFDSPLVKKLFLIQSNNLLGTVNNVPFKFELYNDEGQLLSTTTFIRNCISLASLVGGAADGLMEYSFAVMSSSTPQTVIEPPVQKAVPTGTILNLEAGTTDVEVTFNVVDLDSAITGNLRIDVEETAALGVVVSTEQIQVGLGLQKILTGLLEDTGYTVFIRCDYDDEVNTPVLDFDIDSDTVTTLAAI